MYVQELTRLLQSMWVFLALVSVVFSAPYHNVIKPIVLANPTILQSGQRGKQPLS